MRPQALWTRSLLLVFAVGLLALIAPGAGAFRPAGKPSGQSVTQLEQSYQQERQAADKTGLTKMFSPEWFERSDSFAKAGAVALKAGRLIEARDSFRRARWSLPSQPLTLPHKVSRILGDNKLHHAGPVNALAFNKAGTRLLTAGEDGVVKVWDVATGKQVVHYISHQSPVHAAVFSHDGKLIASGGKDKEVRLW